MKSSASELAALVFECFLIKVRFYLEFQNSKLFINFKCKKESWLIMQAK